VDGGRERVPTQDLFGQDQVHDRGGHGDAILQWKGEVG
jgi:hypothetical protein